MKIELRETSRQNCSIPDWYTCSHGKDANELFKWFVERKKKFYDLKMSKGIEPTGTCSFLMQKSLVSSLPRS